MSKRSCALSSRLTIPSLPHLSNPSGRDRWIPSRLICPFGVGLPSDAPSTRPVGGEAAAAAPETSVPWRIPWSVADNFDATL